MDVAQASDQAAATLRLDPNTAARDDLMRLPGVGEVMANRIIQHRPYRTLNDLLNVSGIGSQTLQRLSAHLAIAAPAAPATH